MEYSYNFPKTLIKGTLLKRYKRFLADIELPDGSVITAHSTNTGSMKTVLEPPQACLISPADNPERKLKFTLEALQVGPTWVGVNTSTPNKLVFDLWQKNPLPHWKDFDRGQAEVKVTAHTRLDMALWKTTDHPEVKKRLKPTEVAAPMHLVEVKNTTMCDSDVGVFPDSVTERGQKHLKEMMLLMDKGYTCEMVYIIQRDDVSSFAPAESIDPTYGDLLAQAMEKGLRVTPIQWKFSPNSLELTHSCLPVNENWLSSRELSKDTPSST